MSFNTVFNTVFLVQSTVVVQVMQVVQVVQVVQVIQVVRIKHL